MVAEAVIETEGLTKTYGPKVAVDSLNLRINRGEIYGFLGPNGAGKTTTILTLLGLTEPSSGRIEVLGFNPTRQPLEVKRRVSYLPENLGFYRDMTGLENLRYVARLNGLPESEISRRTEDALRRVDLSAEAGKLVSAYSRGMRQRLGLAGLLVRKPEMMILDEPTLGLDPKGMSSILALIRGLSKEEGMTVLLCSHQLQQVQEVCDRVGIMNRGRLAAQGTIRELALQGLESEEGKRLGLEEIYLRYFRED
jgi:ABC-2 type transport system ATP-binding protein